MHSSFTMRPMPVEPVTTSSPNRRLVWGIAVATVIASICVYSTEFFSKTLSIHDFRRPQTHHHPGNEFEYPINQEKLSRIVNCLPGRKINYIRNLIINSRKKIWTFWDVTNYPLFLKCFNIPITSWEIQKQKFIKMILEAEGQQAEPFVVGFAGSSVTAGHDNYFYEAYPAVFEATLRPVFESLRVPLVVRNHALGNNPCYPYDACVSTHMGDDLDVLSWEQSFNCGRQSNAIESFTRAAIDMVKKPTVMYLSSGTPNWSPQECVNITAERTTPLTPEETAVLQGIVLTSTNQATISSIAHSTLIMDNQAFLNTPKGSLYRTYAGLAPMGQNVNGFGVYKCKGPYTPQFSDKTPGPGASWHPGKLGHQYRGDNLAFFYLSMLLDALNEVEHFSDGCVDDGWGFSSPTNYTGTANTTESAETASVSPTLSPTTPAVSVPPTLTPSTSTVKKEGKKGEKKEEKKDEEKDNKTSPPTASPSSSPSKKEEKKDGKTSSPSVSPSIYPSISFSVSPSASPTKEKMPTRKYGRILMDKYDRHTDNRHTDNRHRRLEVASNAAVIRQYELSVLFLNQSQAGLKAIAPTSCDKEVCEVTPQCYTDYEPRMKQPLADIIVGGGKGDQKQWVSEISFFDKRAVEKGLEKHLGYLDRKNLLSSKGMNSTLSLLISVSRPSAVWVCEVQKGFAKYPATMGELDVAAAVHVDYDVKAEAARKDDFKAKLAISLTLIPACDQCYKTKELLPIGSHVLSLTQKTEQQFNVAYLLYW